MLGLSLDSLSYLILYDTSKAKFLKMEEEFNIKKAIAFLDFGLEKKAKKKFKALPDLFELEVREHKVYESIVSRLPETPRFASEAVQGR